MSRFHHPYLQLFISMMLTALSQISENWSRHAVRATLVHYLQLFLFLDLVGNSCDNRLTFFLAVRAGVRSIGHSL